MKIAKPVNAGPGGRRSGVRPRAADDDELDQSDHLAPPLPEGDLGERVGAQDKEKRLAGGDPGASALDRFDRIVAFGASVRLFEARRLEPRIPGVTIAKSGPHAVRIAAISSGDATTPCSPAARAIRASVTT